MRIPIVLFSVAATACFFSFSSCKKGNDDGGTPPAPPPKPDTLTTGWSKVTVPGGASFGDVFFNSNTTGYVVGSNIHKSTDGGNTWNIVSATSGFANAFMTNDGKAFFAGPGKPIFKTIDGGINFINTTIGGSPHDLFFTDNNNGFCVADNGLYSTNDAGVSWQKITTTGFLAGYIYSSLYCINNTTGWIVTSGGVYRSVGSLANWQLATVAGGFGPVNYVSVYATSATNVYVATQSGEIFKSIDGGINFSRIIALPDASFTDLHFVSDQVGYACSGGHIYKTTNGGANWSTVVALDGNGIYEIHFTDATHGWATAGGSVLIFKQ
ncbi:MAG TPA: YCF48-related protein [Ferruginibacter sp.]|nr:YCF48-related protein [Ferruginibacter sp.]